MAILTSVGRSQVEIQLRIAVLVWGAVAQTRFDMSRGEVYEIRFRNGVEFAASTPEAVYQAAKDYAVATKRLTGEYP